MGSTTTNVNTVFCFDAETGKEIWKYSYDCPLEPKYFEGGTTVTPTVDGNTVFTMSRRGHLFCLTADTGKVLWQTNVAADLDQPIPTWGFSGSAYIEKNLVIFDVGDAGMAFDKATGKVVWQSAKKVSGYSTAVPFTMGGKKAIAMLVAQSVVAVEPETGKELWRYPWKTQYDVNAADPIFSGNKVFISAGYDHGASVIEINGTEAKKVWENKGMRNHINSCVLIGGYLYGFDGGAGDDGKLKCIDFETGAMKWSQDGLGSGSLMSADSKLIILSSTGELLTAEPTPEGFKPISRTQVLQGKCWTVPVLANGRIFCRNAKGDVVCLDVKGK